MRRRSCAVSDYSTFYEIIEENAAQFPDVVAAKSGRPVSACQGRSRTLTYRDLVALASEVAERVASLVQSRQGSSGAGGSARPGAHIEPRTNVLRPPL